VVEEPTLWHIALGDLRDGIPRRFCGLRAVGGPGLRTDIRRSPTQWVEQSSKLVQSCIAPFAACGHFKIQAGVAAFWPGRPFAQNVLPHLNFDVTCLQPARYNLVRLAPAQELRTALPRG
jgi:hypothetical protein